MVDFLRDAVTGAVIGYKPKIEDLILDPPKEIAAVECDWVTQTRPVVCDGLGRAVMQIHALRDTVLELVHYHWLDNPHASLVMSTVTAGGIAQLRRIEVKRLWGKPSVEAVENAPISHPEELIDMQVFAYPKDFRVHRCNVRLKKGDAIAVCCSASPKARCKVTVAGSEDGSRFTEDPGWWMK